MIGTVFLLAVSAQATVSPGLLQLLVRRSDYVVVAKVERVSMWESEKKEVLDPRRTSGPGERMVVSLDLAIDRKQSVRTPTGRYSKIVRVNNWPRRQQTLENHRKAWEGRTFVFLLTNDWKPVTPDEYIRPVSELEEVTKYSKQARCHSFVECEGPIVVRTGKRATSKEAVQISNDHFIEGSQFLKTGERWKARIEFELALEFDPGNQEAADALKKLPSD